MVEIYAYAPDATDFRGTGLAGALTPTSCEYSLEIGAFGELSLTHPKDELGKWRALQTGVILKCPVPVRFCPEFDESNAYIATVEKWKISSTATKDERTVYKKANNDKKASTIPAGTTVSVLETNFEHERTRIKATVKSGKKTTTYSGWVDTSVLDSEIGCIETIPIAQTSEGAETASPSYAVRDQLFRIYSTKVTDGGGGEVTVDARRIAYDLLGNLCTYKNTGANVSGVTAAKQMLASTIAAHDFTVFCDVSDERVGFDARDKNPIEALLDPESGIAARWGAEVISDDYDLYVLHHAGMDRGYSITYAQNLLGIDCDVDTSDVAVGIRPRGEKKNGDPLYLAGTETLPSGYHFGSGAAASVIYVNGVTSAVPKIYPLDVGEATVDDDVSESLAKQRMVNATIAEFEGGCYLPKISLSVDFVKLGDTEDFAQYKHLEPLFIYDTVHIRHEPLGISADIALTDFTWDVLLERMSSANFGSVRDIQSSVSSWQISSVDGGKIVPGSVGAGTLRDDIINARHIQAESVNADAMQTNTFTADHGFVRNLNGHSLEYARANINELSAEYAHAGTVEAGNILASIAAISAITATSAQIDIGTFSNIVAEAGIIDEAVVADMYATYLRVNFLTAANATIGRCVLKGTDGNWYEVVVNPDGTITATETEVTAEEQAEGKTEEGKTVIEDVGVFTDLSTQTFTAIRGVIDYLDAVVIKADTFIGREATLTALRAAQITADLTLEMIAGTASDTRKWFRFDNQDGLVIRKPEYTDGEGVVHPASIWSTYTDETGYHIKRDDLPGFVASFARGGLISTGIQMGDILAKPTSSGGWVWVDAIDDDEDTVDDPFEREEDDE